MSDAELTEQIARVLDKNYNPDEYPIMAAMFRDYAAAIVAHVIPLVQAEALREFGDKFEGSTLRYSGSDVRGFAESAAEHIEKGASA